VWARGRTRLPARGSSPKSPLRRNRRPLADAVGESIQELSKILDDRMNERARAKVDPDISARLFFNALLAFFVEQEILGGKHMLPVDESQYVEHLVDMFVKRLGPGQPKPTGPKLVR
jgi:hypothetical protein